MTLSLIFIVMVCAALAFDLCVANRTAHTPTVKQAVGNSLAWIALSVAFGGVIWFERGAHDAGLYFTAYLMEKSLSVDNLFVFSLIFTYFNIQGQYRHKVLYWGIFGAIALRLLMIGAGVGLVQAFSWVLYPFGAWLVFAGVKMFRQGDEEPDDVGDSLAVRIASKLVPIWKGGPRLDSIHQHGGKFFMNRYVPVPGTWRDVKSKRFATTMLLALVAVELADVIFAVDSIPVVVAFTKDFTLAFTSNLMAILGLRSLFFLLDHLLSRLIYLPYALGFALAFIGVKMLSVDFLHIPTGYSIGVIVGALGVATVASIIKTKGA